MSKAKDIGYWILAIILTVLVLGGYLIFVNVSRGPDYDRAPETKQAPNEQP